MRQNAEPCALVGDLARLRLPQAEPRVADLRVQTSLDPAGCACCSTNGSCVQGAKFARAWLALLALLKFLGEQDPIPELDSSSFRKLTRFAG
jgi:hypothetical protein